MAKAPPCPLRTLKTPLQQQSSPSSREEEGHWVAMEDRRRRSIAFEKMAKRMLRHLHNSDDMKVGITDSASGPASDERKWPSWARWNAQLKGLVELERRCRNTRQEVQVLSDRQEICNSTKEDKLKLQSRATERYHDQIFEEMKELEEKESEEALPLVQKKHDLWGYQNERDEARKLQSSGNS